MKQKPDLSFWKLWNLSFGFFGVQIAYSLQNANISGIFSTLGADPHTLSFFWVLPPLMGMLVQPVVGTLSDKTWTRFGRRIPYLFVGAATAVAVMCLLPNAGSFGLSVGAALWFGACSLMLLDTSINMAMQPFKMLVGDMVNERQKGKAYSLQSFLCNAGGLVGFVFPFLFTALGIANTAPKGQVPDSVVYSFYIGALILILCVVYTVVKVKEWAPKEYTEYNPAPEHEEKVSWLSLLQKAPATFWHVSLVQFFCWAAFLYMWTYTTGTIGDTVWGTTDVESAGYQDARNWTGIVFGVQTLGAVVWAMVLSQIRNMKAGYALSLVLGAAGFAMVPFISNQYMLFLPFLLIGCAWAAMLAMPFALVTNALQGYGHMGAYLGLFNCAICIPQIIAALIGGTILSLVGSHQYNMMLVSAVSLVIGACCVFVIKTKTAKSS